MIDSKNIVDLSKARILYSAGIRAVPSQMRAVGMGPSPTWQSNTNHYNFSKYISYAKRLYIIAHLYGHIMIKTFASDGLLYAYKTYKVIKLYRHVSLCNNIIIVI